MFERGDECGSGPVNVILPTGVPNPFRLWRLTTGVVGSTHLRFECIHCESQMMPRGTHCIPVREMNVVHAIPQGHFTAPEPWGFVPDSLQSLAMVYGPLDGRCRAEEVGSGRRADIRAKPIVQVGIPADCLAKERAASLPASPSRPFSLPENQTRPCFRPAFLRDLLLAFCRSPGRSNWVVSSFPSVHGYATR
jgi:hypothetical protein